MRNRKYILLVAGLVFIAGFRVALSYRDTAQGFDEPCHVAAAIELLDRHSYTLDPVHPPLARLAIGIPLYIAGERFPQFKSDEGASADYNVVGNRILYDNGKYLRNLVLARVGMLPFLIAASIMIFLWCRREFGRAAGVLGVFFFTTTPIVLAFSSIAYTDLVAATTQFASLFAFSYWLERPGRKATLLLGIAAGLAAMSKLTSFLFLPCAAAAIIACRWWFLRESFPILVKTRWRAMTIALAIAVTVLWSGYGFSVGHLRDGTAISVEHMPTFNHFPAAIAGMVRTIVLRNPLIPAPAFWQGVAEAWVLNKTSPPAYLLGHIQSGGWWYFFFVGLVSKHLCRFFFCASRDCIHSKSTYGTDLGRRWHPQPPQSPSSWQL